MKTISKTLTLLFFVTLSSLYVTTTSCSKDDDKDAIEVDEAIVGAWQGTYSGDDSGTFQMTINAQGKISGSATSTNTGETFTLTGSVKNSDGGFSAGSTSNGATFTGTVAGTSMNGTWESSQYGTSGTFTGSKVGSGPNYAGNWGGTYTGDDTGIFQLTINAQGSVSGSATSSNTGESFTLSGSIDSNGNFTAGTTSDGATFTGSITGDSMSGTWESIVYGTSGTFTGSRL